MNKWKMAVFVFCLILTNLTRAEAQAQNNADSLVSLHVRQFAKLFSLNTEQQTAFLSLEKKQAITMDSIAHLTLTSLDKQLVLRECLKKHDFQLRAIFNDQQWKDYQTLIEKRREQFLKNAADKQIKISEIKRDSL